MKNCPDCGAEPGHRHSNNCDVERCPECGHQLISCSCRTYRTPRIPWSGLWPGVMECREFGWYAKLVPGKGWIQCERNDNDPAVTEDLNRLYKEAYWDKNKARFIRKD